VARRIDRYRERREIRGEEWDGLSHLDQSATVAVGAEGKSTENAAGGLFHHFRDEPSREAPDGASRLGDYVSRWVNGKTTGLRANQPV